MLYALTLIQYEIMTEIRDNFTVRYLINYSTLILKLLHVKNDYFNGNQRPQKSTAHLQIAQTKCPKRS